MKLLLDTHYVLWFANEDEDRLRPAEAQLLASDVRLAVSVVSLWELHIKWHKLIRDGDVDADLAPEDILDFWVRLDVEIVDLTASQAVMQLAEPIEHPDPFDRLLLTQAHAIDARLLTRYRALAEHPYAYSLH